MNKKAIVFTFIAIIMVILLIATFLLNISNRAQRDIQKTTIKIEALSSLVNSLNNELLQESLRSSSNQVFLAFLNHMDNKTKSKGNGHYKGHFIKGDINKNFQNAIMDGYYKNDELDYMFMDDLNYTLTNATRQLAIFLQDNGANFTFNPINKDDIRVFQPDPWHINVSFIITYDLNDSKNEVNWVVKNKPISILLNVQDYRDPLSLVSENQSITINRTDVTIWSLEEFKRHITGHFFIEHTDAPSFLDRLQGKKDAASVNGIESILDPNFFANSGKRSNVDYEYSDKVHGKCSVDGMLANFRLTEDHLNFYQRTGICS